MKIGIPKDGRFGEFGGKYIPETLAPAIEELEKNYLKIRNDKNFKKELGHLLIEYAGRPTPMYFAKNLTKTVLSSKYTCINQPLTITLSLIGNFLSILVQHQIIHHQYSYTYVNA